MGHVARPDDKERPVWLSPCDVCRPRQTREGARPGLSRHDQSRRRRRVVRHFIGTSFIFSDRAVLSTLEGDPRFYFDDSLTPQAQGTGTEEWGVGGDYWGGRNMTLPFAGHPVGARNPEVAVSDDDRIESAYRFLLA